MQTARRPFAANLLRELPIRKDVTTWYSPKSSCGQWVMVIRNKSSETSAENANFVKGLIDIFLGYTLWLRKGRRILIVKEQHQPFLGPPAEKSKAVENDFRFISPPAVESAGRGPKSQWNDCGINFRGEIIDKNSRKISSMTVRWNILIQRHGKL